MKPTLDFVASPNFRPGRRKPISALVIHATGSLTLDGAVRWFARPEAAASAHYVVGRSGEVVQMVKEEDVAWHAGRSAMYPSEKPPREPNVNDFSIGIELVGCSDSGYTDRQLASFYELLAQLVSKYHIPPERVVGHCHIAPGRRIDPDGYDGQFNWSKARAVAQGAYRPQT